MQPYAVARYTIEGDEARGRKHIGQAKQALKNLLDRMRISGVTVGTDILYPEPSVRVTVLATEAGNEVMIQVDPQDRETQEVEVRGRFHVPDFASGIYRDSDERFRPTDETAARLEEFESGEWNVDTRGRFTQSYYVPNGQGGALASLRQLMFGMGRPEDIDTDELQISGSAFDRSDSESFTLPEEEAEYLAFRNKVSARASLNAYEQIVHDSGDRGIDFGNATGITFAADGRPWLVKIDPIDGVRMMPLPLNEESTRPEFQAAVAGDPEAMRIIGDFGGIPDGRGFPTASGEQRLIDAGELVIIPPGQASMGPLLHEGDRRGFLVGWQFSESGEKADALPYHSMGEDQGSLVTHVHADIAIGSTTAELERTDDRLRLLYALLAVDRDQADKDLVSRKMWRLSAVVIDAHVANMAQEDAGEVFQEVIDAVVSPIASCSFSLSQESEGEVFESAQINILGLTQDGALYDVEFGNTYDRDFYVDVPIFIMYVGETLKKVRFYSEPYEDVNVISTFVGSFPGTARGEYEQQNRGPFLLVDDETPPRDLWIHKGYAEASFSPSGKQYSIGKSYAIRYSIFSGSMSQVHEQNAYEAVFVYEDRAYYKGHWHRQTVAQSTHTGMKGVAEDSVRYRLFTQVDPQPNIDVPYREDTFAHGDIYNGLAEAEGYSFYMAAYIWEDANPYSQGTQFYFQPDDSAGWLQTHEYEEIKALMPDDVPPEWRASVALAGQPRYPSLGTASLDEGSSQTFDMGMGITLMDGQERTWPVDENDFAAWRDGELGLTRPACQQSHYSDGLVATYTIYPNRRRSYAQIGNFRPLIEPVEVRYAGVIL